MKNKNRVAAAWICFLLLLAGVCFYAPTRVNASASKATTLFRFGQRGKEPEPDALRQRPVPQADKQRKR